MGRAGVGECPSFSRSRASKYPEGALLSCTKIHSMHAMTTLEEGTIAQHAIAFGFSELSHRNSCRRLAYYLSSRAIVACCLESIREYVHSLQHAWLTRPGVNTLRQKKRCHMQRVARAEYEGMMRSARTRKIACPGRGATCGCIPAHAACSASAARYGCKRPAIFWANLLSVHAILDSASLCTSPSMTLEADRVTAGCSQQPVLMQGLCKIPLHNFNRCWHNIAL